MGKNKIKNKTKNQTKNKVKAKNKNKNKHKNKNKTITMTIYRSSLQDVDTITRDNQLNSPLLRLPGELRNRIYEYVFSGTETVVKVLYRKYPAHSKRNSPVYVLATCRQIHREASSIFWKACIIDAHLALRMDDVQVVMGISRCARITSPVVDENAALRLCRQEVLRRFPMLRKVYVQRYTNFDLMVAVANELRRISTRNLEVECRALYASGAFYDCEGL